MLTHKITKTDDGYVGDVPEFSVTIQGVTGPSRIRASGLSEQSVWNQLNELCRVYHGNTLAPLKSTGTETVNEP